MTRINYRELNRRKLVYPDLALHCRALRSGICLALSVGEQDKKAKPKPLTDSEEIDHAEEQAADFDDGPRGRRPIHIAPDDLGDVVLLPGHDLGDDTRCC